jgi:hypothetical protein
MTDSPGLTLSGREPPDPKRAYRYDTFEEPRWLDLEPL